MKTSNSVWFGAGSSRRWHERRRHDGSVFGGFPVLAMACGLILQAERLVAATKTWTGAGGSDFWSDAGNWSGGVPTDGDDVIFGTAGGGDSFLTFDLSLTAFRFAPAILPEHNFYLTAGAALTLTGFGIDNGSRFVSGGGGVIRQQFYMDEGSTMTFQNARRLAAARRFSISRWI